MTQIGSVYGGALYTLARDEEIADQIREELYQVGEVFKEEPEYLRLLSAANIPRQERCALVDGAFQMFHCCRRHLPGSLAHRHQVYAAG